MNNAGEAMRCKRRRASSLLHYSGYAIGAPEAERRLRRSLYLGESRKPGRSGSLPSEALASEGLPRLP